MSKIIKPKIIKPKLINKGTCAGGSKTTKNGNNFESKTDNHKLLINKYGSIKLNKKSVYVSFMKDNKKITCIKQQDFINYMKIKYNITSHRKPDEAYIIEYDDKKILLILEKKNQNVNGSVDIKLWASPSLKREYELTFENFEVQYCLCVSDYLKNKIIQKKNNYKFLVDILNESNINILYGDDNNYFESLDIWIDTS